MLDHGTPNDPGLVGRVIASGLRVTERTGSTPQGELYQAEYLDGRPVVLLVLHAHATELEPSGARWFRLAARIGHPNVAAVLAVGELENGSTYVVLERLVGEPLLHLVAAGEALPLGDALNLALQVAAGLEAAHHEGFVHGNVSPSTVIVARAPYGKPQVKVVGFNFDSDRQFGSKLEEASTAYASPERLSGSPADKRCDIFSVGAVLHHLLTGTPPSGDRLARAVPRVARPVLAKALAVSPAARFQTMSQLREALEQLASAMTTPPEAEAYWTVLARAATVGVAVMGGLVLMVPLWSRIQGGRSHTVSLPATVERPATSSPTPPAASTGSEPRRAALPAGEATERPARSPAPNAAPAEASRRGQPRENVAPSEVRGYVDQTSRSPEPQPAPTPPAASPPTRAAPRASPPAPIARTPPRSRIVLEAHQALRQSMGDAVRIGLAESIAEASPGLLIMHLAPDGMGVPSALYNLQRLYLAYSAATREQDTVALELRRDGKIFGWFTSQGLRSAEPGSDR
jgi:eukaryotic-like serine/threonine-protein kinase